MLYVRVHIYHRACVYVCVCDGVGCLSSTSTLFEAGSFLGATVLRTLD